MERELNLQLKEIQQNIKQILKNNKIELTPTNMINYTIHTILHIKNDLIISHLYSILFVYKDFIFNSTTLNNLIDYHIETIYQDKIIRLVKILLVNDKHSITLFKNILDLYYKSNNIKLRKLLEMFNIKVDYANSLSDDGEFIKFYNTFFNDLVEKVDFKDRIRCITTPTTYNLLLKYTKYIIDGPVIDKQSLCENTINSMLNTNCINEKKEKNQEEKVLELNFIIEVILSNKDYNGFENTILKIINKILEYNNIHYLKTKEHLIEVSKDLKHLIFDLITNKNTEIKLAQDFFSINRFFIVPHFISVIKNITSDKLLQHIVTVVDIEILHDIIKLDVNLLRFSTNNDISLFLELYKQDNKMFNIMPSFLDYCTDHQNCINAFYDFIITKISTDFFVVCTTIRNILRSHELNLSKDLILKNMISKECSARIIKELTKYDLFNLIINNYQSSVVVNELLFTMSKYIKGLETDGLKIYNDLSKVHLFKFYIPSMSLDLDMISKILEGCRIKNDTQKKFYEILFFLEKFNKISMNVCSELYSLDMVNNLQSSSLKWRIQYLYLRQKKGCCEKSDYCKLNFFNSLVLSFMLGNKNCKEVCEGILEEVMLSFEYKNIFIRFIEENIKNNDINIRCGSLLCYNFILKNNIKDLQDEYMRNIYNYLFVIYKDINALIIIKLFTTYVLYTEDIVTSEVEDVIQYYIDTKKKKYRKDIKMLIALISGKKLFNLNRKVKQYYKFKIKTDNEEIIIKKKST